MDITTHSGSPASTVDTDIFSALGLEVLEAAAALIDAAEALDEVDGDTAYEPRGRAGRQRGRLRPAAPAPRHQHPLHNGDGLEVHAGQLGKVGKGQAERQPAAPDECRDLGDLGDLGQRVQLDELRVGVVRVE